MNNPIKWMLELADPESKHASGKYLYSTGTELSMGNGVEMRSIKSDLLPRGAYDPVTLVPADVPTHIVDIFIHRNGAYVGRDMECTEMVKLTEFKGVNDTNVEYETESGFKFTFKISDAENIRAMGATVMISYNPAVSEFEPPVFRNGFATLLLMPCWKDKVAGGAS